MSAEQSPEEIRLDAPASQDKLRRELAEWLPGQGDQLFVQDGIGARLDPLGLTAPGQARSKTGRWQLYASGFVAAGGSFS
jgi:hypothetical protein